jgi:hypothetical protein
MPPLNDARLHSLARKIADLTTAQARNDRSAISQPQLSPASQWTVGAQITGASKTAVMRQLRAWWVAD